MLQNCIKGLQNLAQLDWKGGQLEIAQEIKIWPYKQMVNVQTRICSEELDAQKSLGIWDTNWSPNPNQKTRKPDQVIINKNNSINK